MQWGGVVFPVLTSENDVMVSITVERVTPVGMGEIVKTFASQQLGDPANQDTRAKPDDNAHRRQRGIDEMMPRAFLYWVETFRDGPQA